MGKFEQDIHSNVTRKLASIFTSILGKPSPDAINAAADVTSRLTGAAIGAPVGAALGVGAEQMFAHDAGIPGAVVAAILGGLGGARGGAGWQSAANATERNLTMGLGQDVAKSTLPELASKLTPAENDLIGASLMSTPSGVNTYYSALTGRPIQPHEWHGAQDNAYFRALAEHYGIDAGKGLGMLDDNVSMKTMYPNIKEISKKIPFHAVQDLVEDPNAKGPLTRFANRAMELKPTKALASELFNPATLGLIGLGLFGKYHGFS